MAGPAPFKVGLVRIARAEAQSLRTFCRSDQELEERIKCYGYGVGNSILPHTAALFRGFYFVVHAAGWSFSDRVSGANQPREKRRVCGEKC
jgi:hypothetical protein